MILKLRWKNRAKLSSNKGCCICCQDCPVKGHFHHHKIVSSSASALEMRPNGDIDSGARNITAGTKTTPPMTRKIVPSADTDS